MSTLVRRSWHLAACLLIALLLATPVAAAKAPSYTQYYGHTSEHTDNMVGTVWLFRFAHTIAVGDMFSRCGEYHSAKVPVKNGRFSWTKQFSNGWGMSFRGTVAGPHATGVVRTWSKGHRCDTGYLAFKASRH